MGGRVDKSAAIAEPERIESKMNPSEPGTIFFIVVSKLQNPRPSMGQTRRRPRERTIHS
jgi:hypothetical protein